MKRDSHAHAGTVTVATGEAATGARRFVPPDTRAWPAHWRVPTDADLALLEADYRRGLLPAHSPLLHAPVPPLRPGSAEAQQVAERLHRAARRQTRAGGRQMVGLAAPQVGIAARAILFVCWQDPASPPPPAQQLRCVLNPILQAAGHEQVREMEGCASTGPIRGWTRRATQVRLGGFTPDGALIDERHAGLAARVIQHEIDHLDGILFPRRVVDDHDLLWASAEQDGQFLDYVRSHRRGETPPWNSRLPRDQCDAIRAGVPVFGQLAHPTEETP